MAVFTYIALDRDASRIAGSIAADTPREARDTLRERGLTIQALDESATGESASRFGHLPDPFRGRFRGQVQMFIRELATLIGVGLPLLDAIDTIDRQLRHRRHAAFRRIVMTLRDRVASGVSLADAMREQPAIFDTMCVNLVEVGENSGQLDTALEQLASFRDRQQQFRGKVGAALLYPSIVLSAGVGVTIFLMTFVTPSLLESLIESGKPLPWATRVVKTASDALVQWWWLMLLGVVATIASGGMALATQRGRRWRDRFLLKLPVFGEMARKQAVVRLAVIVATLMRSGIEFLRALEVAERSATNVLVREALASCREAVTTGREIGEALESSGGSSGGVFPPTVVQVFDVGQQSGRLEEMLDRLAEDYDRQVAALSGRLASLLEPVLILLLAVLVGFIAFATILPILEAGRVV